MRYLRRFNEMVIYDVDIEKILPKKLTVQSRGIHTFIRGNIMKNADMFQITYVNKKNEFGYTDCLEIDLYTVMDSETQKIRLDIDITLGDFVVSEFSIDSPNKVKVIQHMTYGTKFCRDCPIFALTDESIKKLVYFLNHINGFKLTEWDLRFLNNKDDFKE